MGSGALALILLLMSFIHAGLTQDSSKSTLTVTPDSPVFSGETVNLTCVIETYSYGWRIDRTYDWRYEWYKDSVMLQTSGRYTVNRDTLTIRGVITSDQGQYWCRGQIRSVWSSFSSAVSLSVKDSPRSTLTVTPDSPVFTGETVNLTCVIETYSNWRWRIDRTSDWRYEWYKDSVMLQTSDRYTVNRDTLTIRGVITSDHYTVNRDTLSIKALNESDQGQYWCRGRRDERPNSSQESNRIHLSVNDSPRSTLTVTPDSPVFTGETVTLKCVIETYSDWRYEWYKDSVMLQSSDRYTVNRDTLTIRGVITSDQDQYWCRGRRDKRPNSSQESNRIHLSVNASSSLLVTAVVVGSSVCLLIFISLLLLWRYKKNKDQQRNINQTSVPNQSAESQPENSPLQSDSDQICDVVTQVKKRDKGDPEPLADVTYSEITVKKNKKKMDKGKSSESGDTLYSELKHNTDRGADAGHETYAQPMRKKNKTHP